MARRNTAGRIYPRSFEGVSPPEFAADANRVGRIRLPLDNALSFRKFEVGGTLLWAVAASSLAAAVDVRFNKQDADPVPFSRGMMLRGLPFSRLYISSDAQPGESLTLLYAVEAEGNINIENPASAFTAVALAKATGFETAADVTIAAGVAGQVLAANAARREALITALTTNAGAVRVGDSNVAAARGTVLQPGETITLDTTAAVHVHNPQASGCDFAVAWTED